jgi:protoporphyrinogen/coproporphyrinogen III oxidase
MASAPSDRIIVVGAGIAGLTTAYRLLKPSNGSGIQVTVYEATEQLGGKIRTGAFEGFPMEDGPDSFVVRKPWALRLCRELGLGRELVAPAPGGVYIWVGDRLERFPTPAAFGVPAKVESLLRWRGMSLPGRLRAAADLFRPAGRDRSDESIMSLLERRIGREAAETLIAPLLASLHAGDPERLGIASTFPELRTWERGHGSLIRGSKASLKAARRHSGDEEEAMFATVWTGLSRMISVLADAVGRDRIMVGDRVTSIRRTRRGWAVSVGNGETLADAVVLATPAFESARLLGKENPEAAEDLAGIPYASTALVTLAFPRGTLTALPPGTGFIVPPGRGLDTVTACTFVSSKWPRAEHMDRAVVRSFVGRAGSEEWLDMDDQTLAKAVAGEVRTATGLDRDPEASRVVRWPRAMPQYEVGHLDRLARLERALESSPGAFVVGSAYRGVGIADCVRQAGETAALVRAYLSGRSGGRRRAPPTAQREAMT